MVVRPSSRKPDRNAASSQPTISDPQDKVFAYRDEYGNWHDADPRRNPGAGRSGSNPPPPAEVHGWSNAEIDAFLEPLLDAKADKARQR